MIKLYLKIALRSFTKNITFSLINLFGLSIAFALFILLILYVNSELRTDNYHEKADRIYRLYESNRNSCYTSSSFAAYISERYPEVEQACRTLTFEANLNFQDQSILLDQVCVADSNHFNVFTYELLEGDLDHALDGQHGLVLTETASRKLFGTENPIDKVISLGRNNKGFKDGFSFIVKAVIKDLPENSSIKPEAFISLRSLEILAKYMINSDNIKNFASWLLLKEGINKDNLEKKLSNDLSKHYRAWENTGLQNLNDIYFNNSFNDTHKHGNMQLIILFIGISFFILIIASINYINLTTAQSNLRAKEVGLRKVVGAYRGSLTLQFLIESCLFVFLSLIIGFLIAELFIPEFNKLTSLNLKVKTFYDFNYLIVFILGGSILGLLSGLYPAFILSSFRPIDVINSKPLKSRSSLIARRVLLVFQFIISITMIVGIIMIYRQIDYMKKIDLGFNKDNVVFLQTDDDLVTNGQVIRDKLLKIPGVEMVSFSSGIPGYVPNGMGAKIDDQEIKMRHLHFDEKFIELLGLEIVEGRNFIGDSIDIDKTYLINQAALKQFGWDDPFQIKIWNRKCVGIVKDFNFASLHQPIGPLFMTYQPMFINDICIRYKGSDIPVLISKIEETWNLIYPETPFNYQFVDDIFDEKYNEEEQLRRIFGYFSFFAIMISCLGLLGLTSFIIQQRTKEIGIRKVHGGSTSRIIRLLTFDFLKWVLLAFIISVPISWYLVDFWLQNFSYRVSIHWWVFITSGAIAVIISSLTVIILAFKTSTMNPVDSLRYE